jgi:hypothetical protein
MICGLVQKLIDQVDVARLQLNTIEARLLRDARCILEVQHRSLDVFLGHGPRNMAHGGTTSDMDKLFLIDRRRGEGLPTVRIESAV